MAAISWFVTLCALTAAILCTVATEMCPRISIENGRVKLRSRNRVAKFRCRRNYLMIEGDRFVTCSFGTWRGNIPKCIGSGCASTFNIPYGRYLLGFGDALVQFECNPGYQLLGSSALSCNGRRWNDTTPSCRAPAHTLYDCSFESTDLCSWTIEEGPDMMSWQWSRGPPAVQAAGSRPMYGHTYGNKTATGHYLYLDGTAAVEFESTSRLYSPVLQPLVDSPACATFWLWMRGPTTGELNVYFKPQSEDLDIQAAEVSFTGHQSNDWKFVYISMQDIDEPFQLVIEAVWGNGYMSDIAVDDFKATAGVRCMSLELTYFGHIIDELPNGYTDDPSAGPPPSPIPITPRRWITVTPYTFPPTTLLPLRTPRASFTYVTQPPVPSPTTTILKITTTTLPTTALARLSTQTNPPLPHSNAVTPPQISTTKIKSTTTTPVATVTSSTSSTTTTTPTTETPTTITTSTKTTARTTTAPRTMPPTTTTTARTTTTTRRTTTTTRRTTTKPSRIRPIYSTRRRWPLPTVRTTKKSTSTTSTPLYVSTTTSSNQMPISNEVKSPEQKRRFSTFLSILLVSLGFACLVILSIFAYKKCGTLRQLHMSEDSDVKYLQQGDEDPNCVGDSDSMIYHPRISAGIPPTGSLRSSQSTSVASSLSSGASGTGNSSSRKPVRPPPPVPLPSSSVIDAIISRDVPYSTLDSTPASYQWQGSGQFSDVIFSTPSRDILADFSDNTSGVPQSSSAIYSTSSVNYGASTQPPPVPPRS